MKEFSFQRPLSSKDSWLIFAEKVLKKHGIGIHVLKLFGVYFFFPIYYLTFFMVKPIPPYSLQQITSHALLYCKSICSLSGN